MNLVFSLYIREFCNGIEILQKSNKKLDNQLLLMQFYITHQDLNTQEKFIKFYYMLYVIIVLIMEMNILKVIIN